MVIAPRVARLSSATGTVGAARTGAPSVARLSSAAAVALGKARAAGAGRGSIGGGASSGVGRGTIGGALRAGDDGSGSGVARTTSAPLMSLDTPYCGRAGERAGLRAAVRGGACGPVGAAGSLATVLRVGGASVGFFGGGPRRGDDGSGDGAALLVGGATK